MIEIYTASAADMHRRLNGVLAQKLNKPFEILHTPAGKPYIKGNPLYFSLSNSGDRGMIVVSKKPVGADVEIFKGRERNSVLSRWSPRERQEITCEADFLEHWTAREAFVKLHGLTLAQTLRRLEFFGGKLYLDGKAQKTAFIFYKFYYGVGAVCTEK